jgi:hypothetical protein
MSPSCRQCHKSFSSRTALQQHLDSSAHSKRCKLCCKSFRNQQALQQHVNSPAHRHECDACGKTLRSQQALQRHLNSPAHAIECRLCHQTFRAQIFYLQHHFAAHFFPCIPCRRSFETQSAIRQHISDSPDHALNTQRTAFASQPTNHPSDAPHIPSIKLDEGFLNNLTDWECSICKEELNIDQESSHLLCDHWFHWSCIKLWAEIQATCPCCRRVIPRSPES